MAARRFSSVATLRTFGEIGQVERDGFRMRRQLGATLRLTPAPEIAPVSLVRSDGTGGFAWRK
jgi:hypothetical protein